MTLPKGARLLPNGDFFLPRRGLPPGPVQGYQQDKNDRWYFKTLYKPCKKRVLDHEEDVCGCGHKVKHYRCGLHGREIKFSECMFCKDRDSANVSVG